MPTTVKGTTGPRRLFRDVSFSHCEIMLNYFGTYENCETKSTGHL